MLECMLIMRRTKEEALVTRQTLLSAALGVFSQKGYSATSVVQIAEAAGMPLGTVKSHVLRGSQKLRQIIAGMDGDD